MMSDISIIKLSEVESKELIKGTNSRFVHTEHMTVAYWEFEAGVPLPAHSHPHEQVTNIMDGVFDLTVEGETLRLEAGMVVIIPPNARHAGKAITRCQIIDVFYPVRDDYR
jgi:quercetin dioxygenase-like cupin family protein